MSKEDMNSHGDEVPFGHLLASKPPRSGKGTAAASLVSIVVHALVLSGLLYVTRAVAKESTTEEQLTVIDVPANELVLPPPPPPAGPPEVVAPDELKGFKVMAAPDLIPTVIPPPAANNTWKAEDFSGVGVQGGSDKGRELRAGEEVNTISPNDVPHFVPMTQRPALLNEAEVVRTLERAYPPLLRDAGIGGKVGVWFFIDEHGKVLNTRIQEPSEHAAFNDAALKVAQVMKFAPAMNRDKKVPVWVAIPIHFSIGR
jgi:protein TonB